MDSDYIDEDEFAIDSDEGDEEFITPFKVSSLNSTHKVPKIIAAKLFFRSYQTLKAPG